MIVRIRDKRRPILRVALLLLILAGLGLHAAGALFLTTASTRGLVAVPAPLPYLLLGVVLAGLLFKVAHVARLMHERKGASAPQTLYVPEERHD
jgi:hypothetical protein